MLLLRRRNLLSTACSVEPLVLFDTALGSDNPYKYAYSNVNTTGDTANNSYVTVTVDYTTGLLIYLKPSSTVRRGTILSSFGIAGSDLKMYRKLCAEGSFQAKPNNYIFSIHFKDRTLSNQVSFIDGSGIHYSSTDITDASQRLESNLDSSVFGDGVDYGICMTLYANAAGSAGKIMRVTRLWLE